MRNDLARAFGDLMKYTFAKYNGVLLEKHNGGFRIYKTNKWFPTWEKACEVIDSYADNIDILNSEKD
jgi:hypothetical protein